MFINIMASSCYNGSATCTCIDGYNATGDPIYKYGTCIANDYTYYCTATCWSNFNIYMLIAMLAPIVICICICIICKKIRSKK